MVSACSSRVEITKHLDIKTKGSAQGYLDCQSEVCNRHLLSIFSETSAVSCIKESRRFVLSILFKKARRPRPFA